MAVPPTLVAEYFSAIVNNDIEMVRELLDGCDGENAVDVNSVAPEGSTALQVALEQKHYELAEILIKRRIKGGLTLLRMVEADNIRAVEFLCKHYDTFKSRREDIFSSRTSDDEFPPETTPVTLASRLNRYEILKTLLQYGAKMPRLDELRRQFSIRRPGRERAVLQLCEALSSEAYLLQTSPDLLKDIFHLTEQLQDIRVEEKNSIEKLGTKDDFTEIEKRLHKMAENVLDYTNAEEVESLLKGSDVERDSSQVSVCCGRGQSPNLPIRIAQGLQMKYKEFIAHKKLQENLWRHWRRGFSQHTDRSNIRHILFTSILVIFWPVFCFLYLILSAFNRCEPFIRIMRTPYVKFILHASSRVTFLLFLILRVYFEQPTVFKVDDAITQEETLDDEYIKYKSHSTGIPGLIFLWIAGVTWRELTELRDQGIRTYMDIGSGFVDLPQIALYWIYLIFAGIAHVQVVRTVHQDDWLQQVSTSMTLRKTCDSVSSGSSNCTTRFEESRLDWYAYEPLLIAEAAFAVANVFTFVRLLDITVLIAGLGALQVSFKKMFYPIFKFLSLFAFVWLSFSLGMTQLFRSFEEAALELCAKNKAMCPDVHFTDLWASLTTFFWMLFGHGGLDYFHLPPNLHFSENIGFLVYAIWHVAVVMFLMKILIGLTSSVYGKIQQNADTEWKFARTKMVSEYMIDTAVVPPPFNIVPSTASIAACFKSIGRTITKDSSVTEEVEMERRRAKTIRLEERQQTKAIKLTHNYKMITGMVRRRYARSVMKSQYKVRPSDESQAPTKPSNDRSQIPHEIKAENSEEFRRLNEKCDTLTSDMKAIQESIEALVNTLKKPDVENDEST